MRIKTVATTLILPFFFYCSSSTVIDSIPSGGKLYLDGSYAGKTPYTHSDTKVVGSSTAIEIKKKGCRDFRAILTKDERVQIGPIIGGMCLVFPFIWVMGYNPQHNYELECEQNDL